jgi:FSR family fosmidomycin resistance protein-like MFS transporter
MEPRSVVLLTLGHFVTDINQGALPALLPFLIAEYHLTYTAAAFIVFSSNIASSVVQPVFGHLADRISAPWLMPAGIALAGAGLAATGLAADYSWVLVSVMLSGIGVAAFHPQGAQFMNRVAGARKATAMSIFGVGGTLGFAAGPVIITTAVLHLGLKGSLIVLIPAGITAAVLLWQLSAATARGNGPASGQAPASTAKPRDAWGPFARLTAAVVTRAIMFYGFNTFVPLYWIGVLRQSKASGAMALTVFALASVVGNLIGGRLADRFGHTRVAAGAFCTLIPLIPTLLGVSGAPAALAVLALIGMALSTTYSPLIILGQKYLPNHIGLSSGVTLGVAITLGGMAMPILGQVADHYGLWAALAALGLLPILATGLALALPSTEGVQTRLLDGVPAQTRTEG